MRRANGSLLIIKTAQTHYNLEYGPSLRLSILITYFLKRIKIRFYKMRRANGSLLIIEAVQAHYKIPKE